MADEPIIISPENQQVLQNFSNPTAELKQAENTVKMASLGINPEAFTDPMEANAAGSIPASVTPIGNESKTMGFKVKITAEPNLGDGQYGQVIFESMPTVSEAQAANYAAFSPVQHPGDILKYTGTSSKSWGINVKLISRTPGEASDNLRKLNIIRSWVMPFYGLGTARNEITKKYLGAPPQVLTLSAYGSAAIGPVKCVLENYNWDWPNDVDYINTIEGTPFPVIGSLTLNLKESWSPAEFSNFDLMEYRKGNLNRTFSNPNGYTSSKRSQNVPPLLDRRNILMSEPVNVSPAVNATGASTSSFTTGVGGVSINKTPNAQTATAVANQVSQNTKPTTIVPTVRYNRNSWSIR